MSADKREQPFRAKMDFADLREELRDEKDLGVGDISIASVTRTECQFRSVAGISIGMSPLSPLWTSVNWVVSRHRPHDLASDPEGRSAYQLLPATNSTL
jgi:hypothetical protein